MNQEIEKAVNRLAALATTQPNGTSSLTFEQIAEVLEQELDIPKEEVLQQLNNMGKVMKHDR